MIFLYTINNTDVLLLSRLHHYGFVMKPLSPPPSRQEGPREHPFRPPPLLRIPTTHLCKFARNPSGLCWDEQIMLATPPPGKEVTGAMSHNCHMKKHSGGVLRLSDEHLRCTFMPLPGADCRIGMQRAQDAEPVSFSGLYVPDEITCWLSKKNWLFMFFYRS